MSPDEVKARCAAVVRDLERAYGELNSLLPHLRLRADERMVEEAVRDLGWVISNCTILSTHAARQAACAPSATEPS
jgi:hypothetical protein